MVNFKEGLKVGQDGEQKTADLLRSLHYEVYKCNGEEDCDLYIRTVDGRLKTELMTLGGYYEKDELKQIPLIMVECKRDSRAHETGNLAFEILSSARHFAPGAVLKTQAHLLSYVTGNEIYLINRAQLLSWVILNLVERGQETENWRLVSAHDNEHVRNLLIPIKQLMESKVDIQVFPLVETENR